MPDSRRSKASVLWESRAFYGSFAGFSHFAVLDISLTERVIKVYDSIPGIAKKWVTGRIHRLLRSVVGGQDDFRVEVKKCAEQVNGDDCGVYAMANMRMLLFGLLATLQVDGWKTHGR